MTGKDARGKNQSAAIWKTHLGWALSVIAVATICFVANRFWKIDTAEAQNPNYKAGNTANPVRQTSGASADPNAAPANGAGTQQGAAGLPSSTSSGGSSKLITSSQGTKPPELKVVWRW